MDPTLMDPHPPNMSAIPTAMRDFAQSDLEQRVAHANTKIDQLFTQLSNELTEGRSIENRRNTDSGQTYKILKHSGVVKKNLKELSTKEKLELCKTELKEKISLLNEAAKKKKQNEVLVPLDFQLWFCLRRLWLFGQKLEHRRREVKQQQFPLNFQRS